MRFTVSEVLGEAWSLYTRHSGRLILIGAIVFGFLSAVQALINSTGQRALVPIAVGVTVIGAVWLQGALVVAVDDLRKGKVDLSIAEVFRRVEPRLWALLGSGILVAIAVVAGLALFVIPGLVLITFWSVVTPAIVLEGKSVLASIGRSQQLVSGNFFRVFAVIAITVVLATVVNVVISSLFLPLPAFFDVYVAGVIANSVTVPFVALAWTVMFFELRVVKG